MDTTTFIIGIDVSKHTLDLCLVDKSGKTLRKLCISNTQQDFATIAEEVQRQGLASGMYIYRLETGGKVLTKKLMLLK